MKIPDKASITLRKASEISMGAKKITHGWQFGIFSDDEVPFPYSAHISAQLQNESGS